MKPISEFLQRVVCPKNCSNQMCDYCLITPNQQILFIETDTFKYVQLEIASAKLQNNTVNSTMSITINRLISSQIHFNECMLFFECLKIWNNY